MTSRAKWTARSLHGEMHRRYRRRRWLATSTLALLATLIIAACTRSEAAFAALGLIDTNVATRPPGASSFTAGSDGQDLAVGELLRTDATGYAEIDYADGSQTRLGALTDYTLLELAENPTRVSGRLEVGRTWHRVEDLSRSEGSFEVETAVGTAAVRGTIFTAICLVRDVCTFGVIEGSVDLLLPDGTVVRLDAGEQVTVNLDGVVGEVGPLHVFDGTDRIDPDDVMALWIEQNADEDDFVGFDRPQLLALDVPGGRHDDAGGQSGVGAAPGRRDAEAELSRLRSRLAHATPSPSPFPGGSVAPVGGSRAPSSSPPAPVPTPTVTDPPAVPTVSPPARPTAAPTGGGTEPSAPTPSPTSAPTTVPAPSPSPSVTVTPTPSPTPSLPTVPTDGGGGPVIAAPSEPTVTTVDWNGTTLTLTGGSTQATSIEALVDGVTAYAVNPNPADGSWSLQVPFAGGTIQTALKAANEGGTSAARTVKLEREALPAVRITGYSLTASTITATGSGVPGTSLTTTMTYSAASAPASTDVVAVVDGSGTWTSQFDITGKTPPFTVAAGNDDVVVYTPTATTGSVTHGATSRTGSHSITMGGTYAGLTAPVTVTILDEVTSTALATVDGDSWSWSMPVSALYPFSTSVTVSAEDANANPVLLVDDVTFDVTGPPTDLITVIAYFRYVFDGLADLVTFGGTSDPNSSVDAFVDDTTLRVGPLPVVQASPDVDWSLAADRSIGRTALGGIDVSVSGTITDEKGQAYRLTISP